MHGHDTSSKCGMKAETAYVQDTDCCVTKYARQQARTYRRKRGSRSAYSIKIEHLSFCRVAIDICSIISCMRLNSDAAALICRQPIMYVLSNLHRTALAAHAHTCMRMSVGQCGTRVAPHKDSPRRLGRSIYVGWRDRRRRLACDQHKNDPKFLQTRRWRQVYVDVASSLAFRHLTRGHSACLMVAYTSCTVRTRTQISVCPRSRPVPHTWGWTTSFSAHPLAVIPWA